ncbi:Zn-dependent protease [Mesoflavibacter sp. HG96]|uniref:M48 family metallopeptidase n=1 Tax=Mesoflavibacter profundi TaxID=2708110 RepID=A0ABT4RY38_9FLAO|nr:MULTISPECIES: M48 family metallopeptidase [Mesoflavibacter]MDA0176466.1 M48 family metallopeptidase [Mesoflavibacter profundi]QIJ90102.1 Zn-dependent protease [Mesoflavibacter sp. HG96]QIJ92830.1 Zn-dependent protease [Mesoflavibacter sp. HG37]
MKYKNPIIIAFTLLMFLSCSTNPFTGKKTLALIPNSQLFPTSFSQYNQVLSEGKVITGTQESEMIKRVGQRIAVAAERWLNANGKTGYLNDYKWEYNLIQEDVVNAWCMPGGKIAFYTGILPVAQNETAIAVIMGHEVAHALANHGQQRMSAGMLQQGLAVAGNIAIKDEKSRNAFNQYYGIGSQVGVMLPFSRSHETEADRIGLYLTAIAGYNPDEGAELWKRMAQASGGQAPPEILSTHPANQTRINNLTALSPQAKAEAKKFGVSAFRPIGNY